MIYILEFSTPLGSSRHQASYYVGYCDDHRLEQRFKEHLKGEGAAITRAALKRGISFKVLATMPGTREDERKLKRQKNTPRIVRKLQAGS